MSTYEVHLICLVDASRIERGTPNHKMCVGDSEREEEEKITIKTESI